MDNISDDLTDTAEYIEAHDPKYVYSLSMDEEVGLHGDGISNLVKIAGMHLEGDAECKIPILSKEEVNQVGTMHSSLQHSYYALFIATLN